MNALVKALHVALVVHASQPNVALVCMIVAALTHEAAPKPVGLEAQPRVTSAQTRGR